MPRFVTTAAALASCRLTDRGHTLGLVYDNKRSVASASIRISTRVR